MRGHAVFCSVPGPIVRCSRILIEYIMYVVDCDPVYTIYQHQLALSAKENVSPKNAYLLTIESS